MNDMAYAIKLYYSGELLESERILKSIIKDDPENINALIRYVNVLEGLGRSKEAGDIRLNIAEIYFREENYPECVNVLEKASDIFPESELALLKGTCLYHMGRYAKALNYFLIAPESADSLFYRGKIYFVLEQYDEALKMFRATITKAVPKEDVFSAYYWLGKTLSALGNQREAVASFQKCISIYRDEAQAYFDLALCFLDADKLDEAERNLLKYQDLGGNINLANLHLGILHCRKGNYEKAIEYLEGAPPDAQSLYWEGLAHYELGFYDNALTCFSEAAKSDTNLRYFKIMGKSHLKLGNYFEAKICFEKALDADPADEELDKLIDITGHYLEESEFNR